MYYGDNDSLSNYKCGACVYTAQVKCNLGSGSFRWSLYPSPSSQGLSSLSTSVFSHPNYMYPGFTGSAVGGPGLSAPSTKHRRRPSTSDGGSSSGDDSVDVGLRPRRPAKPRTRTKTNSKSVKYQIKSNQIILLAHNIQIT